MSFVLDKTLEKDSTLITELDLCQLRLIDNALFPWVILVPKRAAMVDLIDLNHQDSLTCWQEIQYISHVMEAACFPDKLNVAALGNVVSQLHIHIIARFKEDAAWPAPVWGKGHEPYNPKLKDALISSILRQL